MGNFTKTDYRQFIDEVMFLGEEKEFSGTFTDGLKAIVSNIDHALDLKRRAYNFALVNILKKYQIECGDIYQELDNKWNDIKIEKRSIGILTINPLTRIMMARQEEVGRKWTSYIQGSIDIATKHGKRELNE